MCINTLDLDKINKAQFSRIKWKIQRCVHLGEFEWRDTQKGFHIIMKCDRECDDCRFVFDDVRRYSMDFRRRPHLTNVLFEPFSVHRRAPLL